MLIFVFLLFLFAQHQLQFVKVKNTRRKEENMKNWEHEKAKLHTQSNSYTYLHADR